MSSRLAMEAVAELAVLAGQNALSFYRKRVDIDRKSDGSEVTIADRSTEELARSWIEKRFPGDGILGEEHGLIRPEARRRWIIDPIDGTKSFVRRVPLWGTLVALVEDDVIVAGAASFPAVDEVVAASVGEGCWWNGSRCSVSTIADIQQATVLTTDEKFSRVSDSYREGWKRLSSAAEVSRSWGDCYGYLMVATGRAEVMVDGQVRDWDIAPFVPIIAEAGGVLTGWGTDDNPVGDSIATNTLIAREARALLQR